MQKGAKNEVILSSLIGLFGLIFHIMMEESVSQHLAMAEWVGNEEKAWWFKSTELKFTKVQKFKIVTKDMKAAMIECFNVLELQRWL